MKSETRDFLLVSVPILSLFAIIYFGKKELDLASNASPTTQTIPASLGVINPVQAPSSLDGSANNNQNPQNISISLGGTTISNDYGNSDIFPYFGYVAQNPNDATALSISNSTLAETTNYLQMQNASNQAFNQQQAAQSASQLATITNSAK